MRKHYEKMVQDADKRVLRALRLQNMEVGNPQYGGFMEEDGIYQAKSTIYKLSKILYHIPFPNRNFFLIFLIWWLASWSKK